MRFPRPNYTRVKEQKLKRKNFFPSLLVTVFLWIVTAGVVYFLDPGTFGAVPFFFVIIFFDFLFTFSLIFAGSRRGMVATIASTLFLILLYLGVGNILNLILIVAIAGSIELYFSLK